MDKEFRAWDKISKQDREVLEIDWLKKTIVIPIAKLYQVNEEETEVDWDFEQRKFEDIELREYIGWKDINNVKIFEDDIVFYPEIIIGKIEYDVENARYLIVNEKDHIKCDLTDKLLRSKIIVIGNVWANPERMTLEEGLKWAKSEQKPGKLGGLNK